MRFFAYAQNDVIGSFAILRTLVRRISCLNAFQKQKWDSSPGCRM